MQSHVESGLNKRRRLTVAGKRADVGDQITYDGAFMPAGELGGTADVVLAPKQADHVFIETKRGRRVKVPRVAITDRHGNAASGTHPDQQSPPPRNSAQKRARKSQRQSAIKRMKSRAKSKSERQLRGKLPVPTVNQDYGDSETNLREDSTYYFLNQVHTVKQELRAVQNAIAARNYRRREQTSVGGGADSGYEEQPRETSAADSQANEKVVNELRQQLDAALAELKSMPTTTIVPGKELLGTVVQIKVGGVVPDHYRDLAVDLGVHKGYPGYTVFEALTMCQEAMGASVISEVEDSLSMFTLCLLERAIMLQDDQARRMAEERRIGEPLQIRTDPRTVDEQEQLEATEKDAIEAHEEAVMAKIEPWVNKRDYRSNDCPSKTSIDVGEVASESDIVGCAIIAMACAFMFCGIDGTTHGRYVRNARI